MSLKSLGAQSYLHVRIYTYVHNYTSSAILTSLCVNDLTAVPRPAQQPSYHRAIHDSKELLKLSSLLSSAVLACRQDLKRVGSTDSVVLV